MGVSTVLGKGLGALGGAGDRAGQPAWPGALVNRVGSALLELYRFRRGAVGDAVLLAAILFAIPGHPQTMALSVVLPLGLLATVPFAAVRRWPGPALAAILAANAVFVVFGRLSWPIPAGVGWLAALVLCPLRLPRRAALAALCASEAVVVCAALVSSPANYTPWDATMAEILAVLTAWGLGESLRVRRESAAEQDAAAVLVRELRERDSVARERAAMARELHDVVAHHVSIIAVRAATAPYSHPDLPDPARAVLEEIAGQARTAMAELRTVLGVLRADGTYAEQAPLPGLADLPELVRRVADSGTAVSLSSAGRVRSLPESIELCGYRVVQESLTNVGRHAPGALATVDLNYLADGLSIRVRNGGSGTGAPLSLSLSTSAADGSGPSTGFGLIGMRERVTALGGSLEAGPRPDGGFLVTACLPVTEEPA